MQAHIRSHPCSQVFSGSVFQENNPWTRCISTKTLHHLGLTYQNFSLGIQCLRQTEPLSVPTPQPVTPPVTLHGSSFTSIFVAQILPSIKGRTWPAEILLYSSLFCQTTTSPQVGGISSVYSPFPLLLLRHCLPSILAGYTRAVSVLPSCKCLGSGAPLPPRVPCPLNRSGFNVT